MVILNVGLLSFSSPSSSNWRGPRQRKVDSINPGTDSNFWTREFLIKSSTANVTRHEVYFFGLQWSSHAEPRLNFSLLIQLERLFYISLIDRHFGFRLDKIYINRRLGIVREEGENRSHDLGWCFRMREWNPAILQPLDYPCLVNHGRWISLEFSIAEIFSYHDFKPTIKKYLTRRRCRLYLKFKILKLW